MKELFTLGKICVSDFLKENEFSTNKYELKLMLDENGAVRLNECAPLNTMYGKYWYRSGINQTMRNELEDIVNSIKKVVKLNDNNIWVDIASNDGTMFEYIPNNIIKVGIDPADDSFKKESEKKADLIIQDFFSYDAYKKCILRDKKADIITVIAMFYDLDNPDIFLQDIHKVLNDDGLFVMQMSYTPLMLKQMAFDNIVHEHVYYYSLFNMKKLLEKNGFKIVDCQLNDTNGGSFRIYIKKDGQEHNFHTQPFRDVANFRINSILEYEKTLKLDQEETWLNFYNEINELKETTVNFIKNAKSEGKTIWGYGACHDIVTRLVTDNGIKDIDDVSYDDLVYTINTETGEIELSKIDEIMKYSYNGDMIHFHGKRIDQFVTPNHNILFQTEQNKKFRYESADKIKNRERFSLPKGNWIGSNNDKINISNFVDQGLFSNNCRKIQDEFDTCDFFYLLGLFIGDGYVSSQKWDFSIKYCVPKFDKARHRLIETLNKMNLKFREYDNEIHVASQALRTIFLECGSGAKNKKIPKWALLYSPKYLRYLLDGLIDSDGWYGNPNKKRERYSTSSFVLVKDMIELCIKLGYFPTFSVRKKAIKIPKIRGKEIKSSVSYIVNIGKCQQVCYNKESYPTIIKKYVGDIWCLSVKNKNFLIERNGKVSFSGNSTKGNTLLQYFELDNTLIDGIAERSQYKWGLRTVGTNIPIYSEEDMRKVAPDYLLVLPWHFINEFIEREKYFLMAGGKFIVPCPKFKIIEL